MHKYFPSADFSVLAQVESSLKRDGLTRRRLLQGLATSMVLPSVVACGGKGGGGSTESGSGLGVNSSSAASLAMTSIRHSALLHTEADFTRMRSKIDAGAQPWIAGRDSLTGDGYAQLGANPRPLATVVRGTGVTDANGNAVTQNFAQMFIDMERTYRLALRWKISGDTRYADLAVTFLNAWSSTMTTLTGNADRFLAAGIYGYQWAAAAEIMRSYPGWASADITRFQTLLIDVFYPQANRFISDHNGTEFTKITNYWANWDLCTLCGIYAIGVFCDRLDLCNQALDYYVRGGRGNGAAAHNVYVLHPGYLGQWQESGRDQGHATLGISLAGALCEMAWNQGVDLYGYWNNRFLAGAEYVAKCNLTDASGNLYDMPYATYSNSQGASTGVSGGGRPAGRICWESVRHHYVNRKGLAAPWVSAMAVSRFEGGTSGGDDPGFGTLTYSRDAFVGDIPPSGLTAVLYAGQVLLSWWGSAYASSYQVKRATSASGPFTTIASVTDPRTYTDAPGDAIWYYAITAITPSGETGISNVVRIALPYEARLILPLRGDANDSSGLANHATLNGGASWVDEPGSGKVLALDGASGYVALPNGIVSDLSDFTVSTWVYWAAGAANARIFDFGSGDIVYMGLIPSGRNPSDMRFTTSATTWFGEQSIATSPLATGRWVHIAVTLSGTTASLYIYGTAVASNSQIGFAPFQMGNTTQNWLGRSQYSADPHFNGRMRDFRIYNGALTALQIAALAV
jgi:hypothetical protein